MDSLSCYKDLLRALELITLAALLAAFGCMVALTQTAVLPTDPGGFLLGGTIVVVLTFGPAARLLGEYAYALRGEKQVPIIFKEGLSFAQVRAALRWCPALFKPALPMTLPMALLAVVLCFGHTGKPTVRSATGELALLCVFLLATLPILASASRMPGVYLDHFAPDALARQPDRRK